ncbi:fimbrial protein [Yersinia enterocolitica]|uniref:fimbrial protein n=1 Tax=Yersinia TaxID=629 RepID=UPI003AB5DB88
MNNKLKLSTLLVTSVLFSGNVLAAGEMNFKGKLIEPPNCTINGGKQIEVDFGNEVMTSRVDGKLYIKPVAHGLKCTSPELKAMKLQIKGSGASFDSKSLKTTNENLAIEIQANGKKLGTNEWLDFDYTDEASVPKLTAVPVKNKDKALSGGTFTATATLMVDYK